MLNWRSVGYLFTCVAVIGFAIAGWDLVFGGFHLQVFGVRISSWEVYKPLRVAEVSAVLAFWLHDRSATPDVTSWGAFDRWSASIVAVVSLVFLAVALNFGIYLAGGADGYGYVSQAAQWASGHILTRDPLVDLEPDLGEAVAPLGYRLAPIPGFLAPIYAPGLPIAMAAARVFSGNARAVYFVVPVLAALALWLTYVFASRLADRRTGCIAVVLLAFSPVWLFHSLVPMSDVPVTAWWLLAWVFTLSPSALAPLAAGAATSAAILTRPNIVPLALVLALFVTFRWGLQRGMAYALSVLPVALIIAGLNEYLYASPIGTGYGPIQNLFNVRYVVTNVRQFWTWLLDVHSPFVLLGAWALLAGYVKHAWWLLAFSLVLLGCYVFYLPFDNWTFLRFLMPAIPILFLFNASTLVGLLEKLPLALRGAAAFALCTLVSFWFIARSDSLQVFQIEAGDRRYVTMGTAVGRLVPPDGVILSMVHSGSVRLYGDRNSVRWDLIEPNRLDAAIATLRSHGRSPYFLLEDWEQARVRERFAPVSVLGSLDWPPMAEYAGHARIRLYSVDDRERFLRGEHVIPRMIPSE